MFGAGFTPLSISGCVGWFDAAATATISHSSNAVTQWNDKSASGFNLTPLTVPQRPLTNTNTQNGLNVITYDGSNDELNLNGPALFKNVPGWSMFAVAKTTTNSSVNAQNIVTVQTNGTVTRAALTVRNGNPNSAELFSTARRQDGDSATNVGLGGSAVGTAWFYTSFIGDFATTTGTLYKNGSQIATTGAWCSSGNSSNTNSAALCIGAFDGGSASPSAYWQGDIGEVILYNSALSSGDRVLVETYLANKWGL